MGTWLEAVGRRDASALALVYGRASPQLLAILVRLLRRRELAEEVLHEVFIRVWERAGNFDRTRGSAMGWLIAIARNAALDHFRRHRREVIGVDDLPEAADPFDHAAASVERRALEVCLEQLEPEPRRCVVLAYQGGLNYDELAALVQRPVGTVKSWVRRSLQRLRQCLEAA